MDDWVVGATVIQWDGRTILLEKNGARKRMEFAGEAWMERRIRELEAELDRLKKERR